MTVLQFAYVLLHEKRASRLGDGALDRLLRLLQEVILPAGNHCPPSLHVLKRVLGVGQVSKYEQHVCVNDKCRFAYVPKTAIPNRTTKTAASAMNAGVAARWRPLGAVVLACCWA
jgi:hypothetical protein